MGLPGHTRGPHTEVVLVFTSTPGTPQEPLTAFGQGQSQKQSSSLMQLEIGLASRHGEHGDVLASKLYRPGWPIRSCFYCGNEFRKPPTYATCGHPRCVKMHRASKKGVSIKKAFPSWKPPDIHAADNATREKVWAYLSKVDSDVLDFRLVEHISIRTNLKPAEVLEILKSVKKEKAHAG